MKEGREPEYRRKPPATSFRKEQYYCNRIADNLPLVGFMTHC